jgi:hypothetical protein
MRPIGWSFYEVGVTATIAVVTAIIYTIEVVVAAVVTLVARVIREFYETAGKRVFA